MATPKKTATPVKAAPAKAAPKKGTLAEENKKQNDVIKQFIAGKADLADVAQMLGKSPATVYRYAAMVSRGEEIVDKRQYGNNRKYGKKD